MRDLTKLTEQRTALASKLDPAVSTMYLKIVATKKGVAIANAENNHNLDVDRLVVAEASVGKGLVMKRFQTRGRGRAAGIVKPFAHLTIVVRERAEAEDK